MRSIYFAVAMTLFLASFQASSSSATTALTFSGGINLDDDPTVGWRFTTSAPISVNSLGFFDNGSNGLVAAHQVAIWNTAGGAPLVSATVPGGVLGTLVSGFRFTAAGPVTLPAGDYVIGGDKNNGAADAHRSDVPLANLATAPGITFVENRYLFDGASFNQPSITYGPQEFGYFGPNFQFDVVPEPASLVLFGVAALGCLTAVRRRR